MNSEVLLIFYKNPELGKVKTRLAATLGNAAAFSIYTQLLHHVVSITRYLAVDKIIFYSEHVVLQDIWENEVYTKQIQQGADLGERMSNAFSSAFEMNYERAVIIGTDCPGLTERIITDAFASLYTYDIVIGPAADGGYYLLGMKQHYFCLFKDINWSTETVLAETIKICNDNNFTYTLLPVLHDIDQEQDLIHLENRKL